MQAGAKLKGLRLAFEKAWLAMAVTSESHSNAFLAAWAKIPTVAKAALMLGSAFMAGFGVKSFSDNLLRAPLSEMDGRVTVVEEVNEAQQNTLEILEGVAANSAAAVAANTMALDSIAPALEEVRCIVRAQVREGRLRDCLLER